MSDHPTAEKLLVEWYSSEYGLLGEHVYAECASYLEGLMDAYRRDGATESADRISRCIDTLRAGANFQRVARQYKVKAP